MKILVLNCGSSSIKYQLIDMSNNAEVMAKGLLERVGTENGEFTHRPKGRDKHYEQLPIANHTVGIDLVLHALTDPKLGVISDLNEIGACGHRVAHGGEVFKDSVIIDEAVIKHIENLSELAPLHTPAILKGILATEELLPNIKKVAVFDTSFHQTMPAEAYLYGLPYELYEKYKVRRYGFHGTSHKFVAEKAAKMIGKDWHDLKIITCHLGSGASIAAIKNGQSIDSTMGFTPLEGLVMGTRCGDLDPGVLLYIAEKENMTPADLNTMLNKKSGLMGLCGRSDMRDVYAGRNEGDEKCKRAFDVFAHHVKKYIGAYSAIMNGCDILVMTGGIGENAWFMREHILANMEFLGVEVDFDLNKTIMGEDKIISTPNSRIATMVVTTDEEFVIASDTDRLVNGCK
ncbi:MAG: acetate kinase [Bacteroidales bacterium]|nr:acetate kinase [Bacteroidales bacterium]